MPSTYSVSLAIQLMANNEDNTTWGGFTNANWQLVESAVAGFMTITLSTTAYTLATAQGVASQATQAILAFNGSPGGACTITIPDVSKTYSVYNNTTGGFSLIFSTGVGTTYTLPNGSRSFIFCDGSNVQEMFNYNSNFGAGVSLSGTNTWTGVQTFSVGANVTPAAAPATNAIGYLGLPQNLITTSYATVMADTGKDIFYNTAGPATVIIPANATVAYPIGTIMKISAGASAGAVTLALTSNTLRFIPSNSTGSRTITAPGYATVEKVAATEWWVTGVNIT